MTTFALITEGITDQIVIETILHSHYSNVLDDGDEVDIRVMQPLRDATDEARQEENAFGGWEKVFEHCSISANIEEAAAFNDYIIIQIDTDCAEHKNFGISLSIGGVEKPVRDLIEEVKGAIVRKIGDQLFLRLEEKFVFAIAVHSTECWLLPVYAKLPAHAARTQSCEGHLKRLVELANSDFKKDFGCYKKLSKPLRHRRTLYEAAKKMKAWPHFLKVSQSWLQARS
jgi:hypothetical protein